MASLRKASTCRKSHGSRAAVPTRNLAPQLRHKTPRASPCLQYSVVGLRVWRHVRPQAVDAGLSAPSEQAGAENGSMPQPSSDSPSASNQAPKTSASKPREAPQQNTGGFSQPALLRHRKKLRGSENYVAVRLQAAAADAARAPSSRVGDLRAAAELVGRLDKAPKVDVPVRVLAEPSDRHQAAVAATLFLAAAALREAPAAAASSSSNSSGSRTGLHSSTPATETEAAVKAATAAAGTLTAAQEETGEEKGVYTPPPDVIVLSAGNAAAATQPATEEGGIATAAAAVAAAAGAAAGAADGPSSSSAAGRSEGQGQDQQQQQPRARTLAPALVYQPVAVDEELGESTRIPPGSVIYYTHKISPDPRITAYADKGRAALEVYPRSPLKPLTDEMLTALERGGDTLWLHCRGHMGVVKANKAVSYIRRRLISCPWWEGGDVVVLVAGSNEGPKPSPFSSSSGSSSGSGSSRSEDSGGRKATQYKLLLLRCQKNVASALKVRRKRVDRTQSIGLTSTA